MYVWTEAARRLLADNARFYDGTVVPLQGSRFAFVRWLGVQLAHWRLPAPGKFLWMYLVPATGMVIFLLYKKAYHRLRWRSAVATALVCGTLLMLQEWPSVRLGLWNYVEQQTYVGTTPLYNLLLTYPFSFIVILGFFGLFRTPADFQVEVNPEPLYRARWPWIWLGLLVIWSSLVAADVTGLRSRFIYTGLNGIGTLVSFLVLSAGIYKVRNFNVRGFLKFELLLIVMAAGEEFLGTYVIYAWATEVHHTTLTWAHELVHWPWLLAVNDFFARLLSSCDDYYFYSYYINTCVGTYLLAETVEVRRAQAGTQHAVAAAA